MGILAAFAVPHPPLIIPTVGRGQEAGIQATIDAYTNVGRRICEHAPDTIVISSPHAPLYLDGFHISTDEHLSGDMSRFQAPQTSLEVACDVELVDAICARASLIGIPLAAERSRDGGLDHATFIPLWFIQQAYNEADKPFDAKVVRVGLSGLSPKRHFELGQAIAEALKGSGKRCIYVASGDLSHKLKEDGPYGFAEQGPVLDKQVCAIFEGGRLDELISLDEGLCDKAAECGVRSFQIMAGCLEGLAYTAELSSYEGPFGVGYACAAFEVKDSRDKRGITNDEGCGKGPVNRSGQHEDQDKGKEDTCGRGIDPCVALARASIEALVETGIPIERPEGLPEELYTRRAGAFVSIHEHGQLRGCIGTIAATRECLADEIIANAVSAASKDPRFDPIGADELDFLEISVDVLGDAEPVTSLDELDCKRYGVIVTKGFRRGLLLPDLDGVDSVAEQVAIAKAKAGISQDDSDVEIERFEVVRHTAGGQAQA